MLVTNRKLLTVYSLVEVVETACKSGINIIQLREKDLPSKQLLDLALNLRGITKKYSSLLLINDRLDIALLSKADGVHSPASGVPVKYVKKLASRLLAGKSVHSKSEAMNAEREGYDYLIFGPVFRTPSKTKYGKPTGLKVLKEVCGKISIPVFAIGGITPGRAIKCIEAGAEGVAVMRAILNSGNMRSIVTKFKKALTNIEAHK